MNETPPATSESSVDSWSALGRLARPGALAKIGTSDILEIRQRMAAGNARGAEAHFSYLHGLVVSMVESYAEWAHGWHAFVSTRVGGVAAQDTVERVNAVWHEAVDVIPRITEQERTAVAAAIRVRPSRTFVSAFDEGSASIRMAIAGSDFEAAAKLLDDYAESARHVHDLFVVYVSLYASLVAEAFGQAVAEEGLQESIATCIYYGPWWDAVAKLEPLELAAFLAEEFRAHFSGPERAGSVQVTEEADRYRLVFDPCGSGGAARRAAAVGRGAELHLFSDAGPATWGRAGEVPAYCAHCALNEVISIDRLGYPAWVTDFDPDPRRPCAWTVFKNPRAIPDIYFTRLGVHRRTITPKEREAHNGNP